MTVEKLFFFISLFIIFYSYIGYGILMGILVFIKKKLLGKHKKYFTNTELPEVTLIVAAFNEEAFIEEKIANTLTLNYPANKLKFLFCTDGSSDKTPELVAQYPEITLLHEPARRGKIMAMHRAMQYITTPYVVFCDANTLLNKDSIINLMRHYANPEVGGVAGEKKIVVKGAEQAAGSGEGFYWKYESLLKKLDAELYTVVGAAGELFSIRTNLYEYVGDNVLLDDFIISLRICKKGYTVKYEPNAYAMEYPSASLKEEQKRKIRISAGAFQSMWMLRSLLNPFPHPVLTFQYISHRVLRWTLCPLLLPITLILNIFLYKEGMMYQYLLYAQILFYLAAISGLILSKFKLRLKALFIPYYLVFQNVSLYQGFFRYLRGRQTVLWEKANREKNNTISS